MTRLTSIDIDAIAGELQAYDRYLQLATGRTLLGIGAAAAEIEDVAAVERLAPALAMAAVPIRSGLGIISGFSHTVCDILVHLGFDAWVTTATDVAGFVAAIEDGARVIMAADDDRFVAVCPGQCRIVDNAPATANGFVAGLDLMAGGLKGAAVLVLGCGRVGRWAVRALTARQAVVSVVDSLAGKAQKLAGWAQTNLTAAIRVLPDAEQAMKDHDFIVDATNAGNIIDVRHVTERTRVAAPGMPRGLTDRAMETLHGRVLHDPLQIGVAAMACEAMRIIQGTTHARRPEHQPGDRR